MQLEPSTHPGPPIASGVTADLLRSGLVNHRSDVLLAAYVAVLLVAAPVAGLEDWTVDSSSPVLAPGGSAWDALALGQPCVRLADGRFRMWYAGVDAGLRGRILLAESTDGVIWTRAPQPALSPGPAGVWDGWAVDTPEVVETPQGWSLYYYGQRAAGVAEGSSIGLATSTDGVSFLRSGAGPVLEPGPPGSWEERWVESPAVAWDPASGRWLMLYSGVDAAWRAGIGLATSDDGVHWTKHVANPVLTPAVGPAWDDYRAGVPTLLRGAGVWWMLYSGVSETDLADGVVDHPAVATAWSADGVAWHRVGAAPLLADAWAPAAAHDAAGRRLLVWFETPAGISLAAGVSPLAARRSPTAHRVPP